MTQTLQNNLPLSAAERATSFITGRPFVHEDGTTVRFTDDRWVVRTTDPRTSISFSKIPGWLLPFAKSATAKEWLEENASLSLLTHLPTSFRRALRYLRHTGELSSIADLTVSDVDTFQDELERAWQTGQLGVSAAVEAVSALRKACLTALEQGIELKVAFQLPHAVSKASAAAVAGIGRANPGKVLSEEIHVALIRACDLEIKSFDDARTRIIEAFRGVDWSVLPEARAWRIVSRYLGVDGEEETGAPDLQAEYGMENGEVEAFVISQIRQAYGSETVGSVMTLRWQILAHCTDASLRDFPAVQAKLIAAGLYEADLSERALDLVERRFGLSGYEPHSCAEAAEPHRITGRHAAWIIRDVLAKLPRAAVVGSLKYVAVSL